MLIIITHVSCKCHYLCKNLSCLHGGIVEDVTRTPHEIGGCILLLYTGHDRVWLPQIYRRVVNRHPYAVQPGYSISSRNIIHLLKNGDGCCRMNACMCRINNAVLTMLVCILFIYLL